jgi:membrane-bound ClpP family serine protease
MDPASVVYLILFLIGFGFAVISFLFSTFGHLGTGHDASVDGHEVDVGGNGVDVDGHDVDMHTDGGSADMHLSPVSPITIAMFITSFGGVGFILQQFPGSNLLINLPLALVSGLAIAGLAFYILYKIFSMTQASSNYSRESVLDLEAEVITSIPANGIGEIAYTAKGSRFSAPARSEEQDAIPRHTIVRMTKVVGNIFYVREIPDEKLRRLYDDSEDINL